MALLAAESLSPRRRGSAASAALLSAMSQANTATARALRRCAKSEDHGIRLLLGHVEQSLEHCGLRLRGGSARGVVTTLLMRAPLSLWSGPKPRPTASTHSVQTDYPDT